MENLENLENLIDQHYRFMESFECFSKIFMSNDNELEVTRLYELIFKKILAEVKEEFVKIHEIVFGDF